MDKLILCVDFDGTIVQDAFPNIGEPRQGRFHRTFLEDLIYLQKKGHKIILWTCREGEHLEQAVAFCKERGLVFDAVNDDLEEVKQKYTDKLEIWRESGRARKVFANYYIDDRAVGLGDLNFFLGFCDLFKVNNG